MSEQRPPAGPGEPKGNDLDIPPLVGEVVQKTSRFSREVVATMISLATAAFAEGQQTRAELRALYIYAVVVTLIGVIVIVLLGRLAARLRTEPVEFKYPGIPKT